MYVISPLLPPASPLHADDTPLLPLPITRTKDKSTQSTLFRINLPPARHQHH